MDEVVAAAYANVAECIQYKYVTHSNDGEDMVFQNKIAPALPYAQLALTSFEKIFGPQHSASIHAAILLHKVSDIENYP